MLEIRDLTKVYTTKGVSVRALDGVSLRFPEKGMVFLLGKSGSGKSTLLNLCGGLDTPDSGEIVIKGRSSKDFTQSDFDSYRNTFIGFVFQEYNILNEFSVEDNIALALELQGKSKDRARVQEILRQVDLEQFARRKPNTLSGGQKQRVAIARALVKNPEIIMADEPTGALDSKTGKQVFDTLKKLSGSKLVIVVSHDREFAEVYGDRIIELKDGKVISDVAKEKIQPTRESDNLTFIGEDTISVQDGSRLTDADMGRIRAFLSKVRGRVLLTGGEKEIADFKKAARIDDSGARETFAETNEAAIPAGSYTEADSRFIRSKLPVRHAVRIGASSMKVKPFRLFFTILLSFIAFTLFGLFSTLTFYNAQDVTMQSYTEAGYSHLTVTPRYRVTEINYNNGEENYRLTSDYLYRFTPEQLEAFSARQGGAVGAYNFSNAEDTRNLPQKAIVNATGVLESSAYYHNYIYWFAEVSQGSDTFDLLTQTDLSSLGSDDVVLSSYLFDALKEKGMKDRDGAVVRIEEYQDIMGEQIALQNNAGESVWLTVRGVFRADPPAKYDVLKERTANLNDPTLLMFSRDLMLSPCTAVLVGTSFYDAHLEDFETSYGSSFGDDLGRELEEEMVATISGSEGYGQTDTYIHRIAGYDENTKAALPYILWTDGERQQLSDGEILLSADSYIDMIDHALNELLYDPETDALWNDAYREAYDEYRDAHWNEFYQAAYEAGYQEYYDYYRTELNQSEETARQNALDRVNSDAENNLYPYADAAAMEEADRQTGRADFEQYMDLLRNAAYGDIPSGTEMREAFSAIAPYIDRAIGNGMLGTQVTLRTGAGAEAGTYTIVGTYFSQYNYVNAVFSEPVADRIIDAFGDSSYYEYKTNHVASSEEKYNAVFLRFPDRAALSALVEENDSFSENDEGILLQSALTETLEGVNGVIDMLSQVFLWVGVVMAVFSMLLLFNFISVSITYKKREIGILRAVGARSADVFRIFFSESAIISAVCFVLSVIASIVVCGVLNNVLAADLGASIFVFGPLSVLALLGIAAVTSFIATFLPVYGIAKKKPVESIRAL